MHLEKETSHEIIISTFLFHMSVFHYARKYNLPPTDAKYQLGLNLL